MNLTVGSCFSGVGGIELGLERAGMQTKWQVEIDPTCQQVLAHHWPDVTRFEDVTEMKAKQWRLTQEQKQAAVEMYQAGLSCGEIANYFGVTRQSMWDVLRRRTEMRSNLRYGDENHFFRGGVRADDHAQNLVEKAIARGSLIRPDTCERCGKSPPPFKDGRSAIQAHHCDYNKPLDVMWLCQPCHHEWHEMKTPIELEGGDAYGTLPPVDVLTGGFP